MEIIEAGHQATDFNQFERAVERMEGLDPLPAVAQRLLSLSSDPEAAFQEIEQLVASDVALAARVLRLSASPLYGGRSPENLQSAIVRLGMMEVRNLAVSACVLAKPPDSFHRSLWQYSLCCAVTAEVLARRLGRQRFCEPFVCGLLHELGTLVMAKVEGPRYYPLVEKVGSALQVGRERELYGFSHCDIGALAAQRWNLFEGLEPVIQFHHEPSSAAQLNFAPTVQATVDLVALASRMVYSPGDLDGSEDTSHATAGLGVTEGVIRETLREARTRLGQYVSALD